MGHASSKEVHHEAQHTRRLSKPPKSLVSFNVKQPNVGKDSMVAETNQHPPLDESMFWKSPWTGDLLPKVTPELDSKGHTRGQSSPSVSALHPEPPMLTQGSRIWSSLDDLVLMKHDNSLSRSSSYITRQLSMKSLTTRMSRSHPQISKLTLQETRKEPVIHCGPSDNGIHDLRSSIESLTAEEKSPIEDWCVPMSRRQSYRRPGIATRTPSWALHRSQLSSIRQEDEKEHSGAGSVPGFSRLPLYRSEQQEEYVFASSSTKRASSPVALDYSYLGGFKKGTLRIVNGSVSPASNDRILASSPAEKLFSKEEHAIVTTPDGKCRDESIGKCDNDDNDDGASYYAKESNSEIKQFQGTYDDLRSEAIDFPNMEKAQSLMNVDSGYSSVGSIRSDNSSGKSNVWPLESPSYSRHAQPEGQAAIDKESYFYFQRGMQHDIETEVADYNEIEQISLGGASGCLEPYNSCPAGSAASGCPRFYNHLGHWSFPPVPDEVSIDARESEMGESELGADNDAMNCDSYVSDSAMESSLRLSPQPESSSIYDDWAITTSQKTQKTPPLGMFSAERGQDIGTTRGRTRSRSIGHGRKKLVKIHNVQT